MKDFLSAGTFFTDSPYTTIKCVTQQRVNRLPEVRAKIEVIFHQAYQQKHGDFTAAKRYEKIPNVHIKILERRSVFSCDRKKNGRRDKRNSDEGAGADIRQN
jgi:hypothetical protein